MTTFITGCKECDWTVRIKTFGEQWYENGRCPLCTGSVGLIEEKVHSYDIESLIKDAKDRPKGKSNTLHCRVPASFYTNLWR